MAFPPRNVAPGIRIAAEPAPLEDFVANSEALSFAAFLERGFRQRRGELAGQRSALEVSLRTGAQLLPAVATAHVRADSEWRVAAPPDCWRDGDTQVLCPPSALDGPVAAGATSLLVDLEDSLGAGWNAIMHAHSAFLALPLADRARMVRLRGWWHEECSFLVDAQPCSAGLFDLAVLCFNLARSEPNAQAPIVCLPDIRSALEAQWWNDVLSLTQDELGIERGRIRAAVEIASTGGLVEIDEILYELREHAFAIACDDARWLHNLLVCWSKEPGRWIARNAEALRSSQPAQAWRTRLVAAARKRGAITIGGRFGYLPATDDVALGAVLREQASSAWSRSRSEGFDAICQAHAPAADFTTPVDSTSRAAFPDGESGAIPSPLVAWLAADPLDPAVLDDCVGSSLVFIASRMAGQGHVAWRNRLLRAAEADVACGLLWHWVRAGATAEDGAILDDESLARCATRVGAALRRDHAVTPDTAPHLDAAVAALLGFVAAADCPSTACIDPAG